MRSPCPYCGERDVQEFAYRGDASPVRPIGDDGFYEYVYVRKNPAGPMREHWYHAYGCRNWIEVQRNTQTHEITGSVFAKPVAP
jgi:sarcosine oxidase subunit delta